MHRQAQLSTAIPALTTWTIRHRSYRPLFSTQCYQTALNRWERGWIVTPSPMNNIAAQAAALPIQVQTHILAAIQAARTQGHMTK